MQTGSEKYQVTIEVDTKSGDAAVAQFNQGLSGIESQAAKVSSGTSQGFTAIESSALRVSRSISDIGKDTVSAGSRLKNLGSALDKVLGPIRLAAYILPGLGIAGIITLFGDLLMKIIPIPDALKRMFQSQEELQKQTDKLTASLKKQVDGFDEYYRAIDKIGRERGMIGLEGTAKIRASVAGAQQDLSVAQAELSALIEKENRLYLTISRGDHKIVGGKTVMSEEWRKAQGEWTGVPYKEKETFEEYQARVADSKAVTIQQQREVAEKKVLEVQNEVAKLQNELTEATKRQGKETQHLIDKGWKLYLDGVADRTEAATRATRELNEEYRAMGNELERSWRADIAKRDAANPDPIEVIPVSMPDIDEVSRAMDQVRDHQQREAERAIADVRSAAGGIFDGLVSRSKSVWETLRESFLSIFLTPVKMAFQDLAVSLFSGVSNARSSTTGGIIGGIGGLASGGGMSGIGTPPFVGSSGGGYGGLLNLAGLGGGLRNMLGIGPYVQGGVGPATPFGMLSTGGKLSALASSPAAMMGGGLLGLMGIQQGGVAGMAMSTGGLALTGFGLAKTLFPKLAGAGPWGALIGAGIGAAFGLASLFRESPEEKMAKKVKKTYGITISKDFARQLVALAQQSFGNNFEMAIRSRQAVDLIELYAMSTGQQAKNIPGKATPTTLVQSGGVWSQQTSSGFTAMPSASFASPGGSVAGGNIYLQLDGPSTVSLLRGETVATIQENPRAVQSSVLKAQRSNYGRREATALQLRPGTLTA
jgi:hypothetical protein